ncbi:MAG: 2Fe-2S iron-sulfur cluster-binding protein, partial [Alphaproteobacteria bacterium]|nr:2Fe-2S iron-sulfur cluster-binding protein [Alphaproteobacteria bacterium]
MPDKSLSNSATEALVVFSPSGHQGKVAVGASLLDAARSLGVDLDSVCGGRGICGRCQIEVGEGDFAKHGIRSSADHLTPGNEAEATYAERKGLKQGRRLACHAHILGDLVIDVPPESQVHRQVVRKRAEARAIELDPVLRLHTVDVAKPELEIPSGDGERLLRALDETWDLPGLTIDTAVLAEGASALRAGRWTVTAAVRGG